MGQHLISVLLVLFFNVNAVDICKESGFGPHRAGRSWGGIHRETILYVPPDKGEKVAMWLLMGGTGETVERLLAYTGLEDYAKEKGFALLAFGAPGYGKKRQFNVYRGSQPVRWKEKADVPYVRFMLRHLKAPCIDDRRIHCAGYSNGARFCMLLASEMSLEIASVAPVAGLRYPRPNVAKRPMPIIAFHGTEDPVNPWEGNGNPLYWKQSILGAFHDWGEFNGCQHTHMLSWQHLAEGVSMSHLRHCKDGADVQLVKVEGGRHTWPGCPHNKTLHLSMRVGPCTHAISASEMMWKFFNAHRLPAPAVLNPPSTATTTMFPTTVRSTTVFIHTAILSSTVTTSISTTTFSTTTFSATTFSTTTFSTTTVSTTTFTSAVILTSTTASTLMPSATSTQPALHASVAVVTHLPFTLQATTPAATITPVSQHQARSVAPEQQRHQTSRSPSALPATADSSRVTAFAGSQSSIRRQRNKSAIESDRFTNVKRDSANERNQSKNSLHVLNTSKHPWWDASHWSALRPLSESISELPWRPIANNISHDIAAVSEGISQLPWRPIANNISDDISTAVAKGEAIIGIGQGSVASPVLTSEVSHGHNATEVPSFKSMTTPTPALVLPQTVTSTRASVRKVWTSMDSSTSGSSTSRSSTSVPTKTVTTTSGMTTSVTFTSFTSTSVTSTEVTSTSLTYTSITETTSSTTTGTISLTRTSTTMTSTSSSTTMTTGPVAPISPSRSVIIGFTYAFLAFFALMFSRLAWKRYMAPSQEHTSLEESLHNLELGFSDSRRRGQRPMERIDSRLSQRTSSRPLEMVGNTAEGRQMQSQSEPVVRESSHMGSAITALGVPSSMDEAVGMLRALPSMSFRGIGQAARYEALDSSESSRPKTKRLMSL
eukprot:TRINITY_DN6633_c0_g1_i1.p1 TRINITY_DN6633_c0_g1~~TRINITY_DN6633_c0_g1_i1.p1  ORF type:complete len:888 (-),score=74.38 TRINITY_DN6633_c0_g1_i1:42-2705(-)